MLPVASRADDQAKPVQVFILMGQSNMVGMGKIAGGEGSLEHAVRQKGKYPYLADASGAMRIRFAVSPSLTSGATLSMSAALTGAASDREWGSLLLGFELSSARHPDVAPDRWAASSAG